MADLAGFYDEYGATTERRDGRPVALDYGRPERAHRAVREDVGVTVCGYDVVCVTGEDRVDYVDNVVSNRVPAEAGRACYALLCDPQGRIETELVAVNDGERLLLLCPPGRAAPTVDGWEAFIQDVAFEVVTDRLGVLGVHGPGATSTVGGVLTAGEPPTDRFAVGHGEIAGRDVRVLRTDAPAGETGFEVVCAADDAEPALRALVGEASATPFGARVYDALTLEAGTPRFESELAGRIPNVAGARSAVDFEKGCFVGQEVVSKVENVGQPSRRLVGLRPDALPAAGAEVAAGGDAVGEVTRAAESPVLEGPIALASVDFGLDPGAELRVAVDGDAVDAARVDLPFVEGSERSGRLPSYPRGRD